MVEWVVPPIGPARSRAGVFGAWRRVSQPSEPRRYSLTMPALCAFAETKSANVCVTQAIAPRPRRRPTRRCRPINGRAWPGCMSRTEQTRPRAEAAGGLTICPHLASGLAFLPIESLGEAWNDCTGAPAVARGAFAYFRQRPVGRLPAARRRRGDRHLSQVR